MSYVASFFGLDEANDRILSLARKFAVLLPLVAATIQLSTTFFMIFIAEAVGQGSYIEGMRTIGLLIVIMFIVQVSLDYPTGAIGDWIGQRYILATAFLCFAFAFYLVSLVTSHTPFLLLVSIYVAMGVGQSQMSGAFQAWFDNNYRVAMPGDSERKQYGVFFGKVMMLFQIVATLALIPGSILAAVFGRPWVFQIQAILCVVIAIVVMQTVKDFPEVQEARQERPSFGEYKSLLTDGIKFLFSSSFVLLFIFGTTLTMSVGIVWSELLLFPMYYSYLLTDVAVAAFRTVLFVPGVFQAERSGVWSRRFEPKKWIPRFRLLQGSGFLFYSTFAVIMLFLPPVASGTMISLTLPLTNITLLQLPEASMFPVILIATIFTVSGIFGGFSEILSQRIMLDVVPNRIRNSIYSLTPTIATIMAIPQIALFGWLIPVAGFPLTMALCGLISLIGVVMIYSGLRHPVPTVAQQEQPLVIPEAPLE
ncbi:MAG: MFS transporter [Candidatus Thorarchaeota archaeon]|nr:MFS transporter [Candidatus Thorarchaeota archaeon]